MTDFALARKNMVDCQIHPAGVVDERILEAFKQTPREIFVPASLQKIAYNDENTPLGNGRFLLEPIAHSRMLQALMSVKSDKALDIGGGSGYSASILARLCGQVSVLEPDPFMARQAEALWRQFGQSNVHLIAEPSADSPYDIIFINGAVAEIPDSLARLLSPQGRMVVLVKEEGKVLGRVMLVKPTGAGSFSGQDLFETGCPYLPGFEPRQGFRF